MAFGAPFAAAGAVAWFLPCFLPWLAVRLLKIYPGYDATIKFLMGIFTIPLGAYLVFFIASKFNLTYWKSMSCVVLSIILGLLALHWWRLAETFLAELRAQFFFEKEKLAGEKLAAARAGLLKTLRVKHKKHVETS